MSAGKILNGWLSNWTFWQLEQFLGYKAEAAGKQIVSVDARYTSQKCSNCGKVDKKSRNGSRYCCTTCQHAEHADINAAKNILNNYILSIADASHRKIEQALCQYAECIDGIERASDTSLGSCTRGN